MLAREYLRENAERLLREMPERFAGAGLDRYVAIERERREAVTRLEEKRRRRNALASAGGKPSPEALSEMKTLKEEIKGLEEEAERGDAALAQIERAVPNVPEDSVPRGPDASANHVLLHRAQRTVRPAEPSEPGSIVYEVEQLGQTISMGSMMFGGPTVPAVR